MKSHKKACPRCHKIVAVTVVLCHKCHYRFSPILEIATSSFQDAEQENISHYSLNCSFLEAIRNNNILEIKQFLEKGVDVNFRGPLNETALALAIYIGATKTEAIEVIQLLIQHNVDLNAPFGENEMFPIECACASNRSQIVALLLENGVKKQERFQNGLPILHFATELGNVDLIQVLLNYDFDVDIKKSDSSTALIKACICGQQNVAEWLLKHRADVNVQDNRGMNALHCTLLSKEQDFSNSLRYELASLLIQSGIHLDAETNVGHTALYFASGIGNESVVKLLLNSGAKPDIKDNKGETALGIAARKRHRDVVNLLLKYGANPNYVFIGKEILTEFSQMQLNFDRGNGVNQLFKAPEILEAVMRKLNSLTGLESVKFDINQSINFLRIQQLRKQKGLSVPDQSLHMVFTGNPGTGKTTIARLIAQIYKSMGILTEGQFIETDRAGLVGGYLGQTAIKTQKIVDSALGGVLFIDEAYSLTDNTHGHDMYGQEAVSTLLKMMEDHRDDLIVIVAGYTEPMQKFIRSNPGLQSRFNKFLHFDDYGPAELTEIFQHFAAQGDYKLHPATELKLHNVFTAHYGKRDETFGNARLARNLFEKAMNAHANRMVAVAAPDEASLATLYPEDIPNA